MRKEISGFLQRKYGISYKPETEVIVTIGASQAIDVVIRTLIEPGDEVLIPQPSFVAYKPCTILAGGKTVYVPTYPEDGFVLRPDILEKYITDRSKLLIMPYPNNPTGAVMTKEQLEEVARVVKKYDLLVAADEIYSELT